MYKIELNADLITLNDYTKANRSNRYQGGKIKKRLTNYYFVQTKNKDKLDIELPLKFVFIWRLKNKRRDPDNVVFNKKFILDGFVKSGLIDNDGPKTISGFEDHLIYDSTIEKERITVIIKEG